MVGRARRHIWWAEHVGTYGGQSHVVGRARGEVRAMLPWDLFGASLALYRASATKCTPVPFSHMHTPPPKPCLGQHSSSMMPAAQHSSSMPAAHEAGHAVSFQGPQLLCCEEQESVRRGVDDGIGPPKPRALLCLCPASWHSGGRPG